MEACGAHSRGFFTPREIRLLHCTGPSSRLGGLPLDNSASAHMSILPLRDRWLVSSLGLRNRACPRGPGCTFVLPPIVRVPRRRGAGPAAGEVCGTCRRCRALLDDGRIRTPGSSCSHPCRRLILVVLVGEGIMFILKD